MIWPARRSADLLREAAGWTLAATSAALPLSLALLWVEGQTGRDQGQAAAVVFELEPLPAVLAVAPSPPPAPPVEPQPAPEPEAEPVPETALVPTPEPIPAQQPVIELPPPPVPAPVVLPEAPAPVAAPDVQAALQIPDTRPKERPKAKKAAALAAERPAAANSQAAPDTPAAPAAARKGNTTLEAGWGAAIRKKIERRKSYPKAAGGGAGRVMLRMAVARDGRLETVGVLRSSGNAALDQAAIAAVERAGRLPAAPKGLDSPRHIFTLPMDFAP